jgi:hypothetical protein
LKSPSRPGAEGDYTLDSLRKIIMIADSHPAKLGLVAASQVGSTSPHQCSHDFSVILDDEMSKLFKMRLEPKT